MPSQDLQPPEIGGNHSPSSPSQQSLMPQSGAQPGPPSLPPQMRLTRPTEAQLCQSVMWVAQVKRDFMRKNIGKMPLHEMSENDRIEFSRTLEQLKPLIQDLENKLPMYHHLVKAEPQIQRLIAMIITYEYQSDLMQRNPPNRVITLEVFQSMGPQIESSMIQFQNAIQQRTAVQQMPSTDGLPSNVQGPSQGNHSQISQPPPQAPPQSSAQHPHHGFAPPNIPPGTQMGLAHPTEAQLRQSTMWVAQVRKDFMGKNIGKMPLHEMSENERIEFSRTLEQLKPLIRDLENKLPMYHHLLKAERQIHRLIAMIITYEYQSDLMQRDPPNRAMTLEVFQSMVPQIRTSMIQFQNAIQQRTAVQQMPSTDGLPSNVQGPSQGNHSQVSQPPPQAPTQFSAQHPPHGFAPQNIPPGTQMGLAHPTEAQLRQSTMWVAQARKDFEEKGIGNEPLHEMSENERIEFSRTLKPFIQDLENRLPLLEAESQIQKLIAMIITYGYHSDLMPPNLVMTLEMFQSMIRTSMIHFQSTIQQRPVVHQTSQTPSTNGLSSNVQEPSQRNFSKVA